MKTLPGIGGTFNNGVFLYPGIWNNGIVFTRHAECRRQQKKEPWKVWAYPSLLMIRNPTDWFQKRNINKRRIMFLHICIYTHIYKKKYIHTFPGSNITSPWKPPLGPSLFSGGKVKLRKKPTIGVHVFRTCRCGETPGEATGSVGNSATLKGFENGASLWKPKKGSRINQNGMLLPTNFKYRTSMMDQFFWYRTWNMVLQFWMMDYIIKSPRTKSIHITNSSKLFFFLSSAPWPNVAPTSGPAKRMDVFTFSTSGIKV